MKFHSVLWAENSIYWYNIKMNTRHLDLKTKTQMFHKHRIWRSSCVSLYGSVPFDLFEFLCGEPLGSHLLSRSPPKYPTSIQLNVRLTTTIQFYKFGIKLLFQPLLSVIIALSLSKKVYLWPRFMTSNIFPSLP